MMGSIDVQLFFSGVQFLLQLNNQLVLRSRVELINLLAVVHPLFREKRVGID